MTHLECIQRILKDIAYYEMRDDTRRTAQAYEALAAEAKQAAREIKSAAHSTKGSRP